MEMYMLILFQSKGILICKSIQNKPLDKKEYNYT